MKYKVLLALKKKYIYKKIHCKYIVNEKISSAAVMISSLKGIDELIEMRFYCPVNTLWSCPAGQFT